MIGLSKFSKAAAFTAIAAASAAILALVVLHPLSPDFDPAWRMVSEYALGDHAGVLSAMFIFWGLSSWALALAIAPRLGTVSGKIGLAFLALSGLGASMASVFDVSHGLHGLAALIGIPTLPVAAMLISVSLGRSEARGPAGKALLWTANLTWVSLVMFAAAFAVMITTYTAAGGDMSSGSAPSELPQGTIALVGWANRLLIIVDCVWTALLAALALRLGKTDRT